MADQNFHPALPLVLLQESTHNPRKTFAQAQLEELADSIATKGIIDPIVARPIEDGLYEIASGHRRYRAARLAGLETVPVIIREYSDEEFLEVLTIANLQRQDVHPMEEAAGFAELLRLPGWTVTMLAGRLGKDPAYVYRRLKLLDLTDTARQLFVSGSITLSHAMVLARIPAAAQAEIIDSRQLFDHAGGAVSLQALENWIQRNVQMSLTDAPFNKEDGKLVPEAGPCVTCAKRTGAAPALWPEIQSGDRCMDRECFRRKCESHAHQQLVKLEKAAKKTGVEPVRVSLQYYTQMDGVLSKPKWQIAEEKSCEHSRPAVVVEDGTAAPGMVGDTLQVCTERTCATHWGGLYTPPRPEPKLTPVEKAQSALATAKNMRMIEIQKRLANRRLDLAVSLQTWPPDIALLGRLLAGWDEWALEQVATRLGYGADPEIDRSDALKKDIKLMDEQQLAGLMFELMVIDHDEKDQIIADVISGHNGDSLEELTAAVEEEVGAEYAARIAELEAEIAAASAPAAEQKPKSRKGAKA